ncbi:MAG: hypothetical protein JXR83_02900 [Deltaproteobacteria bacterium]|nr:hypothetical protein [Deltaproteobacteria bacterium]
MHRLLLRRASLACLLLAVAGCLPETEMRDGSVDAWRPPWNWDGGGGDRPHSDRQPTDRRVVSDVPAAGDRGGLPRLDGGGLRDGAGRDGAIGPPRDAARSDSGFPMPGTQPCQVWQDCAPHYGDLNSGYECVGQLCTCDPTGGMLSNCTAGGGTWIIAECYCARSAGPIPSADAGDDEDCWWSWRQGACEPDYWVDTSYQVEECYCCDEYGYDICEWRWIYDGYWASGYCPPGYWEQLCY